MTDLWAARQTGDRIALLLPEPPSSNAYWRIARNRMYRTKVATDYKGVVESLCFFGKVRPFPGSVDVDVHWYRAKRRGDLDNRMKVLLDALKDHAFGDDVFVRRLTAEACDDQPRRARVEVVITPYTAREPAPLW